jgi:MATE family multidrug resistance protein
LAVHDYLVMRSISVLPLFLATAAQNYLQAHRSTAAIVRSMLVANILNVPFSLVLCFGDSALVKVGLPGIGLGEGMGVAGLGLATTIVSVGRYFILRPAAQTIAPSVITKGVDRKSLGSLLKNGWPIGFHWGVEVGVFVTVTVMVGFFGPHVVAGHQIALQLSTFTFCACLGLSGAASVRVGQAVGRGSHLDARRAGITGAVLSLALMSTTALMFLFLAPELISCFSSDPAVANAARPLFRIIAVFQLSDGLQAAMAGALRGLGDARSAMLIGIVGYWFLGFPIGYWLAFHQHLGAPGLWWGLTVGLTFAAICMSIRFWQVSGTPVAPLEST